VTYTSLYELPEQYLALAARQESLEGTTDNDAIATLWEQFNALDGELADKIDETLALKTELRARARARKEEAQRLAALAKEDQEACERLEELVLRALDAAGKKTLETRRFRATIKKNGGQPKLVQGEGARLEDLPEDLLKTKITTAPDLERIRAVLELGETVPHFRLAEVGRHLLVS
jgi:hypothetical protein